MRFLADMGVSLRVVEWLRGRRDDVVHLSEQGLQRLPNGSIFDKATAEGRVVLTFDLDFGEILALSRGSRTSVIVFRLRNTRTGNVIARLERVLAESSDALGQGAVVIVEDGRHRVRLLPVGGDPSAFGPWEVKESPAARSTWAPAFSRYIGIDYSGAKTPTSSLPGLRVYLADREAAPREELPPPSPRKYWTRRGVAEWLVERLREDAPTLVGIDHGFSFPLPYFKRHRLAHDWPAFLDDFQQHWPTDKDHMYVDFVRDGRHGHAEARQGNRRWKRLTEERARSAKSVFHFDVQGSVAKSTHSGLPWLRYLRQQVGERLHFWPFDGWAIPPGRSAIVEVYPSLWRKAFPRGDRTDDQQDAYSVAEWMRSADREGTLAAFLDPSLTHEERTLAQSEGWILGVR
jgi:predicted nuclease of predicted toxin-antitoxin system